MSRSRNRADHEAMTLVRAGGPGSGGLSELIRAYGRRVLRDVKYCDEKLDFLLAILEPEERLLLTASIAELALAAGRPIDEDDLPSPHDASELSHEIRRLANRITRPDLERSVEKRLARLLSSPHDDGKGPAIPSMDLKDRLLSFAGTFNLSLEECSVLLFLYAANLCSEFEALFDNIAFPLGMYRKLTRSEIEDEVESALRKAALWDEVKDKLHRSGLSLSGGQQQRLCIARAVAVRPEVILLDEPCSALDPISTAQIDELMWELREDYCIVIVTHNMQQAARVSDYVGFMYLGELVEFDSSEALFANPREQRTRDYITGRFG